MKFSEYIDELRPKKIAVIGAGVSNLPLIELLCGENCRVTVCDRRTETQMGELASHLRELGASLQLGESYLEGLTDFDLLFRTPGLLPLDPHLQAAAAQGVEITSEMEVFFKLCPCRTIAITGSDGKTTTSTVISELLKAAGKTVHLGGNIGHPLLCEIPEMSSEELCVLELSSFQLHSMTCKPNVAVVTNVSPNHLDVHPDFEDYQNSKKSVYRLQNADDRLVVNADNAITDGFGREAKSRVYRFSRRGPVERGAWYADGKIWFTDGENARELIAIDEIKIPGMHNVENYMAAYCAVEGLVSDETFRQVARTFSGVEHRLELIREIHGVKYINDSIASSPTRALAGLRSFPPAESLILIAGGHDKHVPFDELADEICCRCKALFVCGETAEKIAQAVQASPHYRPDFPLFIYEDWTENVLAASRFAEPGDTVLLSPACSSFDFFQNFAERGNLFRKIVMELA